MTKTIDEIFGIQEKLMDKDILITYKGGFTKDIVNSLLSITKKKLHEQVDDLLIKKRVYNITVECLENIYHYGQHVQVEGVEREYSPMVIVGKKENGFYITGGNLIPTNEINKLKKQLDKIKSLKKQELKEEHRKALIKSLNVEKKGAGIGLIDMALKSGNLIDYYFKTIDADISFFLLEVKIIEK